MDEGGPTPVWARVAVVAIAVAAIVMTIRDVSGGGNPSGSAAFAFAFLAGIALVPREASRWTWLPVGVFAAVAAFGRWNPSNLVVVRILLSHPFVFGFITCVVVLRRLWLGRSVASTSGFDVKGAAVSVGALVLLFVLAARSDVPGSLVWPGVALCVSLGLGIDLLRSRGRSLTATSVIAPCAVLTGIAMVAALTTGASIPGHPTVGRAWVTKDGVVVAELAPEDSRVSCPAEFALMTKGEGLGRHELVLAGWPCLVDLVVEPGLTVRVRCDSDWEHTPGERVLEVDPDTLRVVSRSGDQGCGVRP